MLLFFSLSASIEIVWRKCWSSDVKWPLKLSELNQKLKWLDSCCFFLFELFQFKISLNRVVHCGFDSCVRWGMTTLRRISCAWTRLIFPSQDRTVTLGILSSWTVQTVLAHIVDSNSWRSKISSILLQVLGIIALSIELYYLCRTYLQSDII
jgi:hypothetical protein